MLDHDERPDAGKGGSLVSVVTIVVIILREEN